MKKSSDSRIFFKFHFGFTLVQTIDLSIEVKLLVCCIFLFATEITLNSHTENPQRLLSSSQEIFDAKVEESQRKEQE